MTVYYYYSYYCYISLADSDTMTGIAYEVFEDNLNAFVIDFTSKLSPFDKSYLISYFTFC